MEKQEIFLKLNNIFTRVIGNNKLKENVTLQTNIVQDLCLNSVALVYIVFAIEKEFNISISDVKKETLKTVQDIVDLIHSRIH